MLSDYVTKSEFNAATGCHSPETLDPWLCVPVFQQVCLLFTSYNKANCCFCQRNFLVKTYKNLSKKYESKKSVKISELIVTHDNHSQIFSQIPFRCLEDSRHALQFARRLPLYKSSAQYLPFHYLFPVDQIKQGTDALQGNFHSWIFQCCDGWMIIFRNVLTICSCHTIILRYSFAAVNNCSACSYRQSI